MNKAYESLIQSIIKSSEEGVTIPEAERLAGTSLAIMAELSVDLREADKDRRMRKRGVKAIKSAVRMEEIKKHDKKPTEGYLDDVVNLSTLVSGEEEAFDDSEINKEELERQYGIVKECHLFFRSISKGKFE